MMKRIVTFGLGAALAAGIFPWLGSTEMGGMSDGTSPRTSRSAARILEQADAGETAKTPARLAPKSETPLPSPKVADVVKLRRIIADWSAASELVDSLYAEFERTTEAPGGKTVHQAKGTARYLKPHRARLDITGDESESYVFTGKGEIYELMSASKTATVFRLPPEVLKQDLKGGPVPFLFGIDPRRATERYSFRLVASDDKLTHLAITPKTPEDQASFTRAEIWLDLKHFLPTRLSFLEPDGTRVVFQFKGVWKNVEIKPSDFKVTIPEGWKVEEFEVGGKTPPKPLPEHPETPAKK